MDLVDRISRRFSQQAVVLNKQQIAAHTFRLTIQGDDLRDLSYIPGEHLRVLVGFDKATSLRDKVRTYSIWRYDQSQATIELAVCTYSTGIGARWVQDICVGDTVYFTGPKGKFTVDHSGDFYVFAGDVSALAHLYEINRNLPDSPKRIGFIYANDDADFFPDLTNTTPFDFHRLPQNPSEVAIERLASLTKKYTGKGILYIGGDSRFCVNLNQYFRHSLHWTSQQIKTKPFWAPNKVGLE